jgi:uncharacterized membrane protein YhaH (DUF805 family)
MDINSSPAKINMYILTLMIQKMILSSKRISHKAFLRYTVFYFFSLFPLIYSEKIAKSSKYIPALEAIFTIIFILIGIFFIIFPFYIIKKRLNDLNKSGILQILFYIPFLFFGGFIMQNHDYALGTLIGAFSFQLGLLLAVVCIGFRKGDPAPNRYGERHPKDR